MRGERLLNWKGVRFERPEVLLLRVGTLFAVCTVVSRRKSPTAYDLFPGTYSTKMNLVMSTNLEVVFH